MDRQDRFGTNQSSRLNSLSSERQTKAVARTKLWLWKNFVNGRPEYWAFDNPHPIHLTYGDPITLGEPCGYALFKESRHGHETWDEKEVLHAIKIAGDRAKHDEQKAAIAASDARFVPMLVEALNKIRNGGFVEVTHGAISTELVRWADIVRLIDETIEQLPEDLRK